MPPPQSADDFCRSCGRLRSLGDSKADAKLRNRLAALLRCATHQSIGSDRRAWTEWFAETSRTRGKLAGSDGVDRAAWNKRLAAIEWAKGDAIRGRSVFEKASCAACHSGTSAIGPDLHGVAARFSRDDLLTAILEPSKDIAPQYRAVQLVMKDGKVHQGLIVYDSPDGIMLQTGATTTVRIVGRCRRIAGDHRRVADAGGTAGQTRRQRDRRFAGVFAINEVNATGRQRQGWFNSSIASSLELTLVGSP